jgi:glyoxylase-like metal-dependent hydrolase (beta-lactamase superfamily II)
MAAGWGETMVIQVPVKGYFEENCFFYIDEDTNHGFLIDPGAQTDTLLALILERGWVIEKILLTHGHFDHIAAVNELQAAWGAEVYMQENGKIYAENPAWNLSNQLGAGITLHDVNYLPDDAVITLKDKPDFQLQLRHVPGHTSDGCIYYSEQDGIAFVGDCVFRESYGRTDLPGGDEETLLSKITERILTLPEETVLLSAHSEETTVEHERKMPWYAGRLK